MCSLGVVASIPEQISEMRDNYPHLIALSYGDQQLSYEEFDCRADRFAAHLMQLGVVSGGAVALCMERSFDWIIAALGIMRAGAAYVPLDSAWPDSRLRFAVKDSGATVLVARAALLDHLQIKVRGIDPCRDAAAIASTPGAERMAVQPESLAYVIYTSGSTGLPKGVEITHANLRHLGRWHRETFRVTRQDRASHLAALGFDAAVWEIWPHLAAGATVCLADDAARSSPELLQQWMIRERVTIAFVPTVYATSMIATKWPTTSLRLLLTGGDVLPRAPAVQLPFDVVNNYGPTECTVVATSTVLKSRSPERPTIGRPINGTSVYLLNENGEQIPDGTSGEIYIGGGCVGRGYRNLPCSTERSFLPDPFAAEPGARMYRTGDQGVRRPDGEIEFHGRRDRQTKIRGQRVELDEIASILSQHHSINFATVITNSSEGGEKQLVAYVLFKVNESVPTVQELQKHLLRSLPDYMIPNIFVRLRKLPLSPNGKLDLTILPQSTDANLLEGTADKVAATPIKEKLLTIVQELLENDAVRPEDNFFLAGGNSLLGMRFVMRLRDALGVDLTVRQLFEAPTVERLSLLVESALEEARLAVIWADLLGRKRVGLNDNFFDLGGRPELVSLLQQRITREFGLCIPIPELLHRPTVRQQAELMQRYVKDRPVLPRGVLALQPKGTRRSIFWAHYQSIDLAKALGDDQPFLSVSLSREDVASLGEAPTLQSIAVCLLRKILATESEGPYTIGGVCLGGILAYEIAYQLQAAGHEVPLLVLVDPPNPSYLKRFSSPRYLLRRAAQLGPRMTLSRLRKRLVERCARLVEVNSDRTEMRIAQEMIEAAASQYEPEKYEGNVLLVLAADTSDRVPGVNFLPGWQAVIPRSLHIEYVNAKHSDLMNEHNVQSVVDAIMSRLISKTDEKSLSVGFDTRTTLMQ
jgi:amino acid adenylation domain-containing protein